MKEPLSPTVGFPVFHAGHFQFPGFWRINWNSSGLPLPALALDRTKYIMMLRIKQLPDLLANTLSSCRFLCTVEALNGVLGY